METIVAVSHHKNHHQYYGRSRGHCLQRGAELQTPLISYSMTTPVIRRSFSTFSPKTPTPPVNQNRKSTKRNERSCTIPIPSDAKFENKGMLTNDDFYFSERWAGPAYSNSPPPSSLPMPKFSLQPKRSISLDLATSPSEIEIYFVAKSVPSSPIRERRHLPGDLFDSSDSATKTLRRILNLDSVDD